MESSAAHLPSTLVASSISIATRMSVSLLGATSRIPGIQEYLEADAVHTRLYRSKHGLALR